MMDIALQKKLHTADGDMELKFNCTINSGAFVSLYGNSGSGKTSVLRMIAGLLQPQDGFIKANEFFWYNKKISISIKPQLRKVGFVFQDYALFPNMSVRENIAFGLQKNELREIVNELLELTGLANMASRKTQTLSGGQQQRVALARAIATKPQLLLLDEPLSAIDTNMRRQLQDMLLSLHNRYGLTTILVSHDIEEIVKLSDKIIHLKNGLSEQFDDSETFLDSIGYKAGLTGTVLSVVDNKVSLFMQHSIVDFTANDAVKTGLKKGDAIEVLYNKDATPVINKIG